MRVLHLTPSFHPAYAYGGPTESVYQLCRHLALAGQELRVLTTDANGAEVLRVEPEVEYDEGFLVRYCRRRLGESISPTLLRLLPGAVRWADVVHLSAVYNFPTIPALTACRLYGKPTIWSPRGALSRWSSVRKPALKGVWDRICSAVRPRRLLLHMTSQAEERDCLRRLPWLETRVVPNGVRLPGDLRRVDGAGELRLAYLGRLHPIKGIENLLDACAGLDRDLGRWSLTIGGDGDAEYVRRLKARSAAIGDRVRWIGDVRDDAKQRLFEEADLVIVPSFSENFGIVIAEALAHEVPVIAGRGTPWGRLQQKDCGLWVDNDAESLRRAVLEMARRPLREMGLRGRDWMEREYAWPSVARRIHELYQEAAGSTGDEEDL